LQIFLAALKSEPGWDRMRTVTYTSKDEERRFEFVGVGVAISNLPLRRDPLADALASRIMPLENEPTDEMLADFMRNHALQGFEDMTPRECLEVVEFVIAETRARDHRLDLRHATKGFQDYRQHRDGRSRRHWHDLVRTSLKRLTGIGSVVPAGRAERKAHEQQLARELTEKYPDDRRRRDEEWHQLSDEKSPDAFYRRIREL
jgi:hypothetical protein